MQTYTTAKSLYDAIAGQDEQRIVIHRDGLSLNYTVTCSQHDTFGAVGPELVDVMGWLAEERLIPLSLLVNALLIKIGQPA